jgi:hypothetical protein
MVRLLRWLMGTMLLGSFMFLSILLLAFSLVSMETKDYQWYITAPVMLALLIGGILILPPRTDK